MPVPFRFYQISISEIQPESWQRKLIQLVFVGFFWFSLISVLVLPQSESWVVIGARVEARVLQLLWLLTDASQVSLRKNNIKAAAESKTIFVV